VAAADPPGGTRSPGRDGIGTGNRAIRGALKPHFSAFSRVRP
jgi:hypothetical protein